MFNTLVIPFLTYVMGIVTGYVMRSLLDRRNVEKGKEKIDYGAYVLIAVTTIWVVSMIVDIASVQYETSPLVHGLMGAIVGFFYRPNKKE